VYTSKHVEQISSSSSCTTNGAGPGVPTAAAAAAAVAAEDVVVSRAVPASTAGCVGCHAGDAGRAPMLCPAMTPSSLMFFLCPLLDDLGKPFPELLCLWRTGTVLLLSVAMAGRLAACVGAAVLVEGPIPVCDAASVSLVFVVLLTTEAEESAYLGRSRFFSISLSSW